MTANILLSVQVFFEGSVLPNLLFFSYGWMDSSFHGQILLLAPNIFLGCVVTKSTCHTYYCEVSLLLLINLKLNLSYEP